MKIEQSLTKKAARAELRKFGRVRWRNNTVIVETGNGKYNILRGGEAVNDFPLTLKQALDYELMGGKL